jgi:SHS2 domain-containing protein
VTPRAGWAYFEVAADVGVRAWGPDLATAFAQTLLGVFNLIVPIEAVAPRQARAVEAEGDGPEALLVGWVNEALFLHDREGFVAGGVTGVAVAPARVRGRLDGEVLDPRRHPRGLLVKAATYHDVAVREAPDGVETRLVLDV